MLNPASFVGGVSSGFVFGLDIGIASVGWAVLSDSKRLKLPGAWWQAANAESMLALRVNRANHEWKDYWATNRLQAA